MTIIRINPLLQEHAELPAVVEVSGETVGECLDDLIQKFPQLAQIPYAQTGLPLMSCAREIVIQTERLEACCLMVNMYRTGCTVSLRNTALIMILH